MSLRSELVRFNRGLAIVAAVAMVVGTGSVGCDRTRDSGGGSRPTLMFGRTGIGPLEFNYPRAAAFGPDGTLFVVDKSARIQRISPQGTFLGDWRMPQQDAGKPTGLGVGPDGRVYAADTHYSRVVVYSPDGRLDRQFGSNGEGPGQFMLPTDVEVSLDGEVYVSEYGGNDRISRFSPAGEYRFSFGGRQSGEARLERPQSMRMGRDGTLWVADACNHRVCRFAPDGSLLMQFGTLGARPGQLRFPYNIDVLSDGTLVVCEYGNNRVQRFDASGRSLGIWGAAGRAAGELAYPWAVAIDRTDRVFVVDSGNNRVQVFPGLDQRSWRPSTD